MLGEKTTEPRGEAPTLAIAERALEFVYDDQVVGLGSGRAATAFIHALGQRVEEGLRIRGVPTSEATADLAKRLGIPLIGPGGAPVDLTVDGADEVDPNLDLIKGYGGALVREKIVASASAEFVVLVGSEKLVPVLGSRGILPVEVVPFALDLSRRKLLDLDCRPELRRDGSEAYVTDNGNYILDCRISPIEAPAELDRAILSIPGVIGTGLFLGMADVVLVEHEDSVEIRKRGSP